MVNLFSWLPTMAAAAAVPTQPQASVSAGTLQNLALFSQYAAAAYCAGNNNSPGTKVTCAVGNCPSVEAADTTTVTEFVNTTLTDTNGFVAVDRTNSLIVVSFRGSQSVQNVLVDADIRLVPWPVCFGCFVHAGNLASWLEVRQSVFGAVTGALAQNPTYSITVTGHSLGGAVAVIAATDFRVNGLRAALYTYGQPRTGNALLTNFISQQAGGNFRVTHTEDPVPRLPSLVTGFTHISPEYFISKGEDTVAASDIQVFQGGANLQGNGGKTGLSLDPHLHYFGPIAACGPGFLSS